MTGTSDAGWPEELIALRHGESTANAAFAAAQAAGSAETGLTGRDADVPLSPAGQAQAAVTGRWLAAPPHRFPELVVCSPYRRAGQTMQVVLAEAGHAGRAAPPVEVDERLRDRETGVLELLTPAAVLDRFPAEAERRARVGELHYRPDGGESLADVGLRIASLLGELGERYADRRVLLVTHDAVVLMLCYVIDDLPEADFPRLLSTGSVRNASITRWVCRDGRLRLNEYDSLPDEQPGGQQAVSQPAGAQPAGGQPAGSRPVRGQ